MNIAYLAIDWGELASTAGVVTLQGMMAIFLLLALLWLAIEIMHRFPKLSIMPKTEHISGAEHIRCKFAQCHVEDSECSGKLSCDFGVDLSPGCRL